MNRFFAQRHLLWQLTRRDLAGRYRDSVLGLLWLLLTPLMMLAVYSFVFGVVFETKWGVNTTGQAVPFALLLYSGLILHGFMAELLPQAVSLLRANPNYVKKVVFPIGFLPLKATLTAASLLMVQWMLLAAASMVLGFYPSWHWLWLPMILLPFAVLLLGLVLGLCALGVFIPDLKHIMGLLMTVLLFISPIFYPLERLPALWQQVLLFNPLTFVVQALRDCMFYAQAPAIAPLILYWVVSGVVLGAGMWLFAKLKPAFADVL